MDSERFWVDSGSGMLGEWVDSTWILLRFWMDSGSEHEDFILGGFWIDSEWILGGY